MVSSGQNFWRVRRGVGRHISWVWGQMMDFSGCDWDNCRVVGEFVVEFVVAVGMVVEDMFVDKVVDSVKVVFGSFVAGKAGFEALVRQLQRVGSPYTVVDAVHGPPYLLLTPFSLQSYSQTFSYC